MIERGIIADYTQAARMLGVSQPRMTHLMGLMLLAPAIQKAILMGRITPKDKELRELAQVADWQTQESSIRTTDRWGLNPFGTVRGVPDTTVETKGQWEPTLLAKHS